MTPLIDFDRDGDTDVLDIAILDKIEKERKARKKDNKNNNSGCCVFLLCALFPALLASWGIVAVCF